MYKILIQRLIKNVECIELLQTRAIKLCRGLCFALVVVFFVDELMLCLSL